MTPSAVTQSHLLALGTQEQGPHFKGLESKQNSQTGNIVTQHGCRQDSVPLHVPIKAFWLETVAVVIHQNQLALKLPVRQVLNSGKILIFQTVSDDSKFTGAMLRSNNGWLQDRRMG